MPNISTSSYTGRFAPSPSGPLHIGSLVTAIASYLQAKSNDGKWLLRIDDIDPPREMPNGAEIIMQSLLAHGLEWDGEVVRQSTHSPKYELALGTLWQNGLSYYCHCTRKQIKEAGPYYAGTCRYSNLPSEQCSLRFKNDSQLRSLKDGHLGEVELDPLALQEDFIIKRKDGLYAYHLASVVDDIDMGITEVVRGADLLAPSACQISLFSALGATPPNFVHIPVISSQAGKKLSKQNHAKPIENKLAKDNLLQALALLNMDLPHRLFAHSVKDILAWALEQWNLSTIPRQHEVVKSGLE